MATLKALQQLAKKHGTPILVVDHDELRRNYATFRKHLPRVQAYYAVKAFADPAVFHPAGSVDAVRDLEAMNLELTISDLDLIETRLQRIAQDQKRKFEQERADEAALLERLRK